MQVGSSCAPHNDIWHGDQDTTLEWLIVQIAAPVMLVALLASAHVLRRVLVISAPPKPHIPTVAVVVGGDDVISSPAEDAMVNLLQSRGFRVIEGGHSGGDRPNLRALSGRADAVVFVNARPVGSQEIAYYGQSSTLYTVQLGVKAYRVSDGSVMWTSSTEQVNFTSLNAAEKAREAIEPMLDTVDSRLAEFRSRGGRG